MRIAVLVHSLNGIGGEAKQALCVSREFVAMGHEVVVWSVEYNRDLCYPELAKALDIRTLRRPHPQTAHEVERPFGLRMLAYLWSLWKCYHDQRRLSLAMIGEYDLVNALGNAISWAAAAYKRRHKTPVVWMCDDFWPMASHRHEVVSNTWSKVKHRLKEALCFPFDRHDQAAVREIDKVAVLSERVKTRMMEHYHIGPVVVRAGVEASRFADGSRQRISERYLGSDTSFLLLTVCQLAPWRRIEDVVEAVRILVGEGLDVTYLVVGGALRPAYAGFVREEVSARHLGDRVVFTGEVSEEELVDCYHACDAFVWASDENQSWGLAGMEAMSAGKPVIVSRANGLAEALEDGKTGLLVRPRSPEAIADAVRRLVREPALAKSIAGEGQRLVRERYSWRRHAEELLALSPQAVGSHQG